MNLNNLKYYIGIACILFLASCADSDQIIDQVTEGSTRGAVLRALDVQSNSVAINSGTNVLLDGEKFSVLLEYQDTEDGALLSSMNVYGSYVDNTTGGANSKPEVLITNVPSSSFSIGERGLPTIQYDLTAQEMQSAMGLANDQIGLGGDDFAIRFEAVLTDGRTFSSANNSGNIAGSYFNSPFLYGVRVVCAPSVPTAGTWTFDMTDLYGDGWNGASLSVFLNGSADEAANIFIADGGAEVVEFEVPSGTTAISIVFNSGAWDEEILFTITSANGNDVSAAGPNPPIGAELLDYCADNL